MSASLQSGGGKAAHARPAEIANRSSLDSRRLDFDQIPIIDLALPCHDKSC